MRFEIRPTLCLRDNEMTREMPNIVFSLFHSEEVTDEKNQSYDYHRYYGKYDTVDSAQTAAQIVATYHDLGVIEVNIPTKEIKSYEI